MIAYVKLSLDGVRWRAASEILPLIKNGPFRNWPRFLTQATVIKDLRSKRTLEYQNGDTTWIVKLYKPGSVWKRLATAVRGTRASHELSVCQAVMRLGIPTVPVTAVAEWESASAVIFRKLEGWSSLETALRERPAPGLLDRYGRFARQVHDAGILQDDFNPSNVLIKGNELKLIDFERLQVRRALSQCQRLRLIAKLVRLPTVGRAGLEPFLASYLPAQAPRSEILARILRYAERQAKIDRLRLAGNCLRENRNFGSFETDRYVGFYRKSREGVAGLTKEEARAMPDHLGAYRLEPCEKAFAQWQTANLQALEGSPAPIAVLRKRRSRCGYVVYRT